MAKIRLERSKCIECGSCQALCPKYFEMIADGKSHIKGAVKQDMEELEVEVKEIGSAELAAESCLGQCIYIDK